MAAVKKAQTENKAGGGRIVQASTTSAAGTSSGLVSVTVAAGPIHHAGRRYGPGDSLEVSEEVAAALVAAKLVTKG
jgi:hypothetical protein